MRIDYWYKCGAGNFNAIGSPFLIENYWLFSPASLFFASSTSAIPGSASFNLTENPLLSHSSLAANSLSCLFSKQGG